MRDASPPTPLVISVMERTYVPRDQSLQPDLYGRSAEIDWRDDIDESVLVAARVQHDVAVIIRRATASKFGSVTAYARESGQNYQRVAAVLRGQRIMRLHDVAIAATILDVEPRRRFSRDVWNAFHPGNAGDGL